MFCKNCNVRMKEVFRCEDGKFYKFHRCPHCYFESKVIPYVFDDAETSSGKKGKGKAKDENGNKGKKKTKRKGGQKSTKRT